MSTVIILSVGLSGCSSEKSEPISQYPGCDSKDIALSNGQVWAACNVGASMAFTGENITDPIKSRGWNKSNEYQQLKRVFWSFHQWGRNKDITNASTFAGPVSHPYDSIEKGFITDVGNHMNWLKSPETRDDEMQQAALWGGQGATDNSGTHLSLGSPEAMQWPCQKGYHIPTKFEWCQAIQTINPQLICDKGYQKDTSVISTLKLPLAWYRSGEDKDGSYYMQGVSWEYWASGPSHGDIGGAILFKKDDILFSYAQHKTAWISIRCLRNELTSRDK